MKLTIEKERVLEAAESCSSDAKQILKILFPDVFENEYHEWNKENYSYEPNIARSLSSHEGPTSLLLDYRYDWELYRIDTDTYLRAKKKS